MPDQSLRSWRPPIGIPAPPFGLTETAPPPPDPWTVPTPGCYYVDATGRNATDSGNPFGTPGKPRLTIPTLLPAGAVVELHGTYDHPHSSPATVVAQGTAAQPVFIRGATGAGRPLVRNIWEIRGTYVVLENLEFGPADTSRTGGLVIRAPTNYLVVRHSELHGNVNGGGLAVESWGDGSIRTQNVVILKNSVHDNGNVRATFDQDVHGIHVGDHVDHAWIVDNEMYRNSGDGLQINATAHLDATTHHIYVGRNVSHHNKQSGFWVKQATDVIFSQNLAYAHRPSDSSMGPCFGGQYGPERVWWIYNHAHDCEFGIAQMSDGDDGQRVIHSFFIGNVIHNIHRTTLRNDAEDVWGAAAIMMAGGHDRYVINNTIYDVDSGISSPSPFGSLEIINNIVVNVTERAGSHVNLGFPSLASHTKLHLNLLFPEPRVAWGGPPAVRLTEAQLAAASLIAAPPQFVDPAADDFHLRSDSPAAGRGEPHAVYAAYRQLYGVDIACDIEGKSRPRLSLGAYEPIVAGPAGRGGR